MEAEPVHGMNNGPNACQPGCPSSQYPGLGAVGMQNDRTSSGASPAPNAPFKHSQDSHYFNQSGEILQWTYLTHQLWNEQSADPRQVPCFFNQQTFSTGYENRCISVPIEMRNRK
jgi:hypothetical protein